LPSEGVPAEEVARNAVDELINNLQYDSCVDEHLQDQVNIAKELSSLALRNFQQSLAIKLHLHVGQVKDGLSTSLTVCKIY